MRRMLVIVIVARVLAVAVGTAGCARRAAAGVPPAGEASAGDGPAAAREAAIYVQVLRRYPSPRAENSSPGRALKTFYVLDQAFPDAGAPAGKHERAKPIAPNTQHHITAALAGIAHMAFIRDRHTVLETRDGCAQVKDGGILITLGIPNGDGHKGQVAINGCVPCHRGTLPAYVEPNQPR